jgi:hypothetical protein
MLVVQFSFLEGQQSGTQPHQDLLSIQIRLLHVTKYGYSAHTPLSLEDPELNSRLLYTDGIATLPQLTTTQQCYRLPPDCSECIPALM